MIGAGLIGREGMLGSTSALGASTSPLTALVVGPGSAMRLSVVQFLRALKESRALESTVRRYLSVTTSQLAQTGMTQPRVSALLKGTWKDFSMDMLLTLATRAGLKPELRLAAETRHGRD